jgi:hypothetical protein
MRVNLNVPFARKEEAKSYGARWDAGRKVWYYHTDAVSASQAVGLSMFVPAGWAKKIDRREARSARREERRSQPLTTEMKNRNLPVCDCATPPWEDCEHTVGAPLAEEVTHLREILRFG